MNVLQERPAPRYSGIVKHARDKGQKIKLSYMFKGIFNYIFKVLKGHIMLISASWHVLP